jgi:hypothetical protein
MNKISEWKDPPQMNTGISVPAILADEESETLWMSYVYGSGKKKKFCIVKFDHVIEYHNHPMNDEALHEHPYFSFGMAPYAFNVLVSDEAKKWSYCDAKHWINTFKDLTFEIIAERATVEATGIAASNEIEALLSHYWVANKAN